MNILTKEKCVQVLRVLVEGNSSRVPVILPMKQVLCKKHQTYIVIHKFEEETLFVDDDKKEVTIFTDNKGKRYLKRYVVDGCNENCETVIECLK